MIRPPPNGMHDERGDEAHHHDVRREPEERRVGRRRDDVLLQHDLDAVGEPLQEALRPDAVRPDARLDARPHAALDPGRDAGDQWSQQHEAEERDHQHDSRATSAAGESPRQEQSCWSCRRRTLVRSAPSTNAVHRSSVVSL